MIGKWFATSRFLDIRTEQKTRRSYPKVLLKQSQQPCQHDDSCHGSCYRECRALFVHQNEWQLFVLVILFPVIRENFKQFSVNPILMKNGMCNYYYYQDYDKLLLLHMLYICIAIQDPSEQTQTILSLLYVCLYVCEEIKPIKSVIVLDELN